MHTNMQPRRWDWKIGVNANVCRHLHSDRYSESSGKKEVERRLLSTFAGSHLKVGTLGPSQIGGNQPRLITARAQWKNQCLYEVDIIDYRVFFPKYLPIISFHGLFVFCFFLTNHRVRLGTFKMDCFCSILKKFIAVNDEWKFGKWQ